MLVNRRQGGFDDHIPLCSLARAHWQRPVPALMRHIFEVEASLFESLFGGVLYPWYESRLRGRQTMKYLSEYDKQQWLPAETLQALQMDKLRKLLAHCQETVPYYRQRWGELGINWQDIRTRSDYARLPPITKDDIRAHYDQFISEPWRGKTLKKTTGGSTGRPFSFEYTRESYERRMAVMMRGYGWAGWRPGVKRLDVWGTELTVPSLPRRLKSRLYDATMGRRVMSCFEMNRDNIESFVTEIDRYRPTVIVGYTGALETMATWMANHCGAQWAPSAVITAAEMLSDAQRELLERSFRAPVFHTYGCREFMLIGAECTEHRGYHASEDHLVIEVANDAGTLVTDGPGNIVITDLHNYGMPFIRYVNGDLIHARSDTAACACGRGLPLLGAVEGRRLDMLTTPDGRFIPGEFFPHLIKDVAAIEAFQVRQTQTDQLVVLMVKHGEVTEANMAYLRSAIDKVIGSQMNVEFRFVDEIPLTPSGKRRVAVREISAAP
jgi:phenylacetate-CoA ligase